MEIEIPFGALASVFLPTDDASRVSVNSKPLTEYALENGSVKLMLKSGRYVFEIA
jgi:hypothetical protein